MLREVPWGRRLLLVGTTCAEIKGFLQAIVPVRRTGVPDGALLISDHKPQFVSHSQGLSPAFR